MVAVLACSHTRVARRKGKTPQPASPKFHVRVEAELPDAAGNKIRVVFQGDIQNPVAANRRIEGTWTRGTEKGTVQIRRL